MCWSVLLFMSILVVLKWLFAVMLSSCTCLLPSLSLLWELIPSLTHLKIFLHSGIIWILCSGYRCVRRYLIEVILSHFVSCHSPFFFLFWWWWVGDVGLQKSVQKTLGPPLVGSVPVPEDIWCEGPVRLGAWGPLSVLRSTWATSSNMGAPGPQAVMLGGPSGAKDWI